MKKMILSIALLMSSLGVCAADWFVRPDSGTYGTGDGTSWAEALSGFASIRWLSVACGDTIWVADGVYTQTLNINKNCTSSAPVRIAKTLATDTVPAAAAGYQASFSSGQVVIQGADPGINFAAGGGVHVDGRGSAIVNGTQQWGMKIKVHAGGGDGVAGAGSGSISDIQLLYVEVAGPACVKTSSCTKGAYGINLAPSTNTVSGLLVSGGSVHNLSEGLRASNWNGAVIEREDLHTFYNDSVDHEDTMYSYPSSDVTMRYNFVHDVPNDGIFFEYGGAVNFRLYGNVFYDSHLSLLTVKAPGNFGPMLIYNNVFAAPSPSDYGWIHANGVVTAQGTEVANNVFYNVSNDFPNSHHNAYNYTTLNGYGWPSKEPGSFTFTGDGGMANIAAGDAHISASSVLRNRGAALAADGYINFDMDGDGRGADGAWDIGAYEF